MRSCGNPPTFIPPLNWTLLSWNSPNCGSPRIVIDVEAVYIQGRHKSAFFVCWPALWRQSVSVDWRPLTPLTQSLALSKRPSLRVCPWSTPSFRLVFVFSRQSDPIRSHHGPSASFFHFASIADFSLKFSCIRSFVRFSSSKSFYFHKLIRFALALRWTLMNFRNCVCLRRTASSLGPSQQAALSPVSTPSVKSVATASHKDGTTKRSIVSSEPRITARNCQQQGKWCSFTVLQPSRPRTTCRNPSRSQSQWIILAHSICKT